MSRLAAGMTAAALFSLLVGCGPASSSDSGGGSPTPTPVPTGMVSLTVSDASTEDWATVGVKVLSISLTPQGGGAAVPAYTAPNPAPTINLVQLDQLAEILGNATVRTGTYTGATLTIGANPGDVLLTAAADPEAGFAGTAGETVPSSQIRIQGATGSAGSLTTTVSVNFDSPLVVTANQSNALDLEFDLSHPAFIVDRVPADGSAPFWAVNFKGPVRHHPIGALAAFLLRDLYGTVTAVTDPSITLTKDYAVYPPTKPETAIASTVSLQILADSANGTIFYDVDAKTKTVVHDFSAETSTLDGKYVRVAARYQSDGSLVAVRIWASTTFNSVWLSPEGHVLHVDAKAGQFEVQNEAGAGVEVTVDANTEFFFRTPAKAVADATPIGSGPGFLTSEDLVRGFKVHVSVVDPTASPLVAQTVDIETARYDGTISAATTTGFTYTRKFATGNDDYIASLDFISSSTSNGTDANGNPITGYKWWYFTFPTLAETGANAIPDFVTATSGAVNFGGSVGAMKAWGATFAIWADPADPGGWSAPWTVLEPTPVPLGTVATPWASGASGGFFGITVPNGGSTVSVAVNTTSGSAPLVYQIDVTNGVMTVSAVDITTSTGLNDMIAGLAVGAPVKVFGIPQPDGTIKSYVVFYYTGTLPSHSIKAAGESGVPVTTSAWGAGREGGVSTSAK
jgi:hypothetical protein